MKAISKRLAVSGIALVFCLVQLGSTVVINDPDFIDMAFAQKKGKDHDKDKDKDDDDDRKKKGENGVKRQIKKLQQEIDQLKEQLATIELTPGPQGETGLQGPVGPEGPQGSPGDPASSLDSADGVEIRRIIQLPPADFSCTLSSLGQEICDNIPRAYEAFLIDGSGLSVDGSTAPNVIHFNTLLNTLFEQAPGGNVQVISQNTLNVFVPANIIASGQGAHRFKLENSNGSSAFDFTAVLPGKKLLVVDADSQVIGEVTHLNDQISPSATSTVLATLKDFSNIFHTGVANVTSNGFSVDTEDLLFFTGPNCTGLLLGLKKRPILIAQPSPGSGIRQLYVLKNMNFVTTVAQSFRRATDLSTCIDSSVSSGGQVMVEVKLADSNLHSTYTRPFRVILGEGYDLTLTDPNFEVKNCQIGSEGRFVCQ